MAKAVNNHKRTIRQSLLGEIVCYFFKLCLLCNKDNLSQELLNEIYFKDNIILMSKDKNPTLKITLPNKIALIKFGSSQEEYEKLYSSEGCVNVNIVGKCKHQVCAQCCGC